jgi:hypothetical protein
MVQYASQSNSPMTTLKTPQREFDIFTKEGGAWHFAERIQATTLDEAKNMYLRQNRRLAMWEVTAYPRK